MNSQDLIYTTYIKTTPEKLWQALTTPAFTRQYWGDCAALSDWKKGAQWTLERVGEKKRVVVGEVLEYAPHTRIALSWADPDAPNDVSRVSFELESLQEYVRLVVTHNDFKQGTPMVNRVSKGWPLVLSSLKTFLETGKPIDIQSLLISGCGNAHDEAA